MPPTVKYTHSTLNKGSHFMSVIQIAQELGTTRHEVNMLLEGALKKLRIRHKHLREYLDVEPKIRSTHSKACGSAIAKKAEDYSGSPQTDDTQIRSR